MVDKGYMGWGKILFCIALMLIYLYLFLRCQCRLEHQVCPMEFDYICYLSRKLYILFLFLILFVFFFFEALKDFKRAIKEV